MITGSCPPMLLGEEFLHLQSNFQAVELSKEVGGEMA